jgi:hypothetical protein
VKEIFLLVFFKSMKICGLEIIGKIDESKFVEESQAAFPNENVR